MSFKAGNPAFDVLIRVYTDLVSDVKCHVPHFHSHQLHDEVQEGKKKLIRSLQEAVDGDEYLKVFFSSQEVEKALIRECPVCGDLCSGDIACKGCNLVWEVDA